MAGDYTKKEDIYFRDNTSLDSKINRIIEKNFFFEIQQLLKSGDFFEIDEEEKIQENGMHQSAIITSLLRNLQSEIDDNIALMDKESSFIYLSKLRDKACGSLENIQLQAVNIENNNFEHFFDLKKEDILMRKDFIEVAKFLNRIKSARLSSLIEFVDSNLKYYKIIDQVVLNKLKWLGKPSQLGFIISSLVDLGYLEAPTKQDGEINFTQFAKLVKTTFDVNTTEATLSKYLNQESEKGQEPARKFKENGFDIPHIKTIS
ncbi:hypothetical protein [Olleya sp.]|jgi:hypothetical protein|uniref:hypothetical protein n=1 Tax=Olleya sp. TaxID=1906788 RepID=UPI0032D97B7D